MQLFGIPAVLGGNLSKTTWEKGFGYSLLRVIWIPNEKCWDDEKFGRFPERGI